MIDALRLAKSSWKFQFWFILPFKIFAFEIPSLEEQSPPPWDGCRLFLDSHNAIICELKLPGLRDRVKFCGVTFTSASSGLLCNNKAKRSYWETRGREELETVQYTEELEASVTCFVEHIRSVASTEPLQLYITNNIKPRYNLMAHCTLENGHLTTAVVTAESKYRYFFV